MGIYLSAPKTEKASEDGENDKLRFGLSSMQGWRASMEDAVSNHLLLFLRFVSFASAWFLCCHRQVSCSLFFFFFYAIGHLMLWLPSEGSYIKRVV